MSARVKAAFLWMKNIFGDLSKFLSILQKHGEPVEIRLSNIKRSDLNNEKEQEVE